jgi:drug/metabolite transporter (DMT)-like permease
MSSASRRRAVKDFLVRRHTDLVDRADWAVAICAVVVFVLAAIFAPDVQSRADADDLGAVFGALLGALAALLVAYAAVTTRRKGRLRARALVIAILGIGAALAGLLQIPLDLYRWAFALAVASTAYEALAILLVFA